MQMLRMSATLPPLPLYPFKAYRGATICLSLTSHSVRVSHNCAVLNWQQAATVGLRSGYGDIGGHQGSVNGDDHNHLVGCDAVQFGIGGPTL